MPTEVTLPQVGPDLDSLKIGRWFVADGALVRKGDLLCEVETDKATVEVEAPVTGKIHDIVVSPDPVPVGSPVAWIFAEGEPYAPRETTAALPPESRETPAAAPEPVSAAPAATAEQTSWTRATPFARKLARERGIDLSQLSGSGPNGRVQGRDIPAGGARTASTAIPRAGLHRVWLREGEGRPIVLVHGFGSELGAWRPFLSGEAIARPVLALDLPGHGKSPLTGARSFDDLVAAVAETLRQENVGPADLVGHSLGAAVVTAAAARGLDVRTLLLLSPAGLGPDINGAYVAGFCRARSEASLAPWMRLLVADERRLSPALIRAALRSRQEGSRGDEPERLAAMLFPDGTQSFSVRGELDRIRAPMKIVFGADDRIIPARHGHGLPGRVALHVFAGVGHLPQIEVREDVVGLLSELVRSGGEARR